MVDTVLRASIIYQDIIKENKHKLPQVRFEHHVHQSVESGKGIGKAEGHDQKLIIHVMCLVCVFYPNPYLMIS